MLYVVDRCEAVSSGSVNYAIQCRENRGATRKVRMCLPTCALCKSQDGMLGCRIRHKIRACLERQDGACRYDGTTSNAPFRDWSGLLGPHHDRDSSSNKHRPRCVDVHGVNEMRNVDISSLIKDLGTNLAVQGCQRIIRVRCDSSEEGYPRNLHQRI